MGCGRSGDHQVDSAEVVQAEVPDLQAADTSGGLQLVEETADPLVRGVSETDLVGRWLLEDMGGLGTADGVETSLELTADGQLRGNAGCNRFSGSYTLEEGRLVVGPVAATKKMCPAEVMGQEQRFLRALGEIEKVSVMDDMLVLSLRGSDEPLRLSSDGDRIED
jgi:heat shock protein HslJ